MTDAAGCPSRAVVTGANGFIGKNLTVALRRSGTDVLAIDVASTSAELLSGLRGARVVYHLAGVNRPEQEEQFVLGNVGSLRTLLSAIDRTREAGKHPESPLVVLASSQQAAQDTAYGRSKAAAERLLTEYSARTGVPAVIYRLPGVFGKWCRPNYNSVVATFCYNIARGLPITVSDPARVVALVHIDDVVAQFVDHMRNHPPGSVPAGVGPIFSISLGDLADRISAFRRSRQTLEVADVSDPFTRRLLGTYGSYIPPTDLVYSLEKRTDERGALAELLKARPFGQIFVSRTRPGVTRGNHYHDVKVEKFCVLEGEALIRFRSVLGGDVTGHRVSGADFKVVDIPPGMTHSIENVGPGEMIVLFWASEILDQQRPDTFASEVLYG